MGRKFAFLDEFGAFGFQFDKPNVSTHFIISAIIVNEEDKRSVEIGAEAIRKKYFQSGEMKSKRIGPDHQERTRILTELKALPFSIYVFVVDKRLIYQNSGLRKKKSFYKFLNNYVHLDLQHNFKQITVFADEVGGSDFIQSFVKYIKKKRIPSTLFGDEYEFDFVDSKDSIIIQIADIISGSLAYNYDLPKIEINNGHDYKELLKEKILQIKIFPNTYEDFNLEESPITVHYNPEIAGISFRQASIFINENKRSKDDDIKQQIITLEYLLFRFMNNDKRSYISTPELINNLINRGYTPLSIQSFRNKIIGKLRDKGVVISSCTQGYKIPCTQKELLNFFKHGNSIVLPLLYRLKKCNEVFKMGTNGKVDLSHIAEPSKLSRILDILDAE